MYAAPRITPITGKSTPKQGVYSAYLILFCGALLLALVVITVVLALIPIYLPQRTVSFDPDLAQTQNTTMYIEVEENRQLEFIRRKRDEGNLFELVDGSFGQDGLDMIRSTYLSVLLPKHFIQDVRIFSAYLAYADQVKKRRSVIFKRRAYPKRRILLIVEFRIVFISDCYCGCQEYHIPAVRELLFSIETFEIVYANVPIYKNGRFLIRAPRIECISIVYISNICPAKCSSTDRTTTTIISTVSTATASTILAMITTTTTAATSTTTQVASTTIASTMATTESVTSPSVTAIIIG